MCVAGPITKMDGVPEGGVLVGPCGYRLVVQNDHNVAIYGPEDTYKRALWSTKTAFTQPGRKLVLQVNSAFLLILNSTGSLIETHSVIQRVSVPS